MPCSILIADGNVAALAEVTDWLMKAGYHVMSTTSFDEASRLLEKRQPDLIVADVRLGAFNGLHLVVRSRSGNPDRPAIVTNAFTDPVLEAEAWRLNAIYMLKPLDRERLINAIRATNR